VVKKLPLKKNTKENNNKDTPCFSCSIEQECCRKLRFLRLTKSEYMQHFVQHQGTITVQNCTETYLISSKEGQTCPNWSSEKCTIYTDRPVECRIFPYTLGRINKEKLHVVINYHERTHCPQKKVLLVSDKETKKLILSFAHEAFGNKYTIEVKRENLLAKWITKLKHKILI
jgi:Fe-S-cluster containining protein